MELSQPAQHRSPQAPMRDLALALAAGMLLLSTFLHWFGFQYYTGTSPTLTGWQASTPAGIISALVASFALLRLWPTPAWLRLDPAAGVIVALGGGAAFIALERLRGMPPALPLDGFDTATATALLCVGVGACAAVLEVAARSRFDWSRLRASDGLIAVAGIVLVASTAVGWQPGVTPWLIADSGGYVVALCGIAMIGIAVWRAMQDRGFPLLQGGGMTIAGTAAAAVLSNRIQEIADPTGIAEVALFAAVAVAVLGLWSLRQPSQRRLAAEVAALRDMLRRNSAPVPDHHHRAQTSYMPFLGATVAVAVAGGGMAVWEWGGMLVAGIFFVAYAIGRPWMLWIPWAIAIPVGIILPAIETSQCGPDNDLCGLAWLWLPLAVIAAGAVSVTIVAGIAARGSPAATSLPRRSS